MGGGDIKLMAFYGALWGPEIAFLSIIFAAVAGSVAGLILLLFKKLSSDHRIPFGPYLALGIIISVVAGEKILNAYMQWIETLIM